MRRIMTIINRVATQADEQYKSRAPLILLPEREKKRRIGSNIIFPFADSLQPCNYREKKSPIEKWSGAEKVCLISSDAPKCSLVFGR